MSNSFDPYTTYDTSPNARTDFICFPSFRLSVLHSAKGRHTLGSASEQRRSAQQGHQDSHTSLGQQFWVLFHGSSTLKRNIRYIYIYILCINAFSKATPVTGCITCGVDQSLPEWIG